MSRSRSIVFVVLLLAVASLAAGTQAAEPTVAELQEQITALEKRLTQLEKNMVAQFRSVEQRMNQGAPAAAGAAAANPLEGEAAAAFNKINQEVAQGDMLAAKEQMAAFMQKYSATETAKRARRLSTELQVVGKSSPTNWGIEKWFQGESDIDLASDKTTVVVFWEVWCPHCRREVPKMEEMYSSLKDQGLQLVGLTRITKSATEESVQDFIKEQHVSYPIAKENGEVAQYFNVSGIPAAAVVKGGKIIWRGHPARLSDAMVRGWL